MALNDLTPQLRTRLGRLERVVGWFVSIATLLLLFGLAYYVYNIAERKGWFLQKVYYFTFARSAAGLKVADPIRLMGRDVGEIIELETMPPDDPEHNIYVRFRVRWPYYGYLWDDSRAKIEDSGFLGNRYIEVTKGTNGYATYMFNEFKRVTIAEARDYIGKPEYVVSEEVIHPQTKEILLRPKAPITRESLNILAQAGASSIYVFNLKVTKKPPTAVWDDQLGRYKPVTKDEKGYHLLEEETPAVTERLQAVVHVVEGALPSFLALTNKLVRVLTNSDNIIVHADELLVSAKPIVTNFAQISANLSGAKGTLGEWLLPTNINAQLLATLGSANLAVNSTRTNLDIIATNLTANINTLASNLTVSLENVATLTSNLAAQVQANGLVLTEISDLVIHSDEIVQGLKRHWLLKSAFGPATNAPARSIVQPRIGGEK